MTGLRWQTLGRMATWVVSGVVLMSVSCCSVVDDTLTGCFRVLSGPSGMVIYSEAQRRGIAAMTRIAGVLGVYMMGAGGRQIARAWSVCGQLLSSHLQFPCSMMAKAGYILRERVQQMEGGIWSTSVQRLKSHLHLRGAGGQAPEQHNYLDGFLGALMTSVGKRHLAGTWTTRIHLPIGHSQLWGLLRRRGDGSSSLVPASASRSNTSLPVRQPYKLEVQWQTGLIDAVRHCIVTCAMVMSFKSHEGAYTRVLTRGCLPVIWLLLSSQCYLTGVPAADAQFSLAR